MEKERKCPSCGRIIPIDARLCPYCGNDFSQVSVLGKKKHTSYGIASLVIGIVAICLLWLAITPLFLFLHLPLGVLSVIFGAIAWRHPLKDGYGLVGFILGMIVLVLGSILMLWFYFFVYIRIFY